jgi:hypothetical protein
MEKQFILTKKIAKQGTQAVLVIPRILQNILKPGTLVKITLDVLESKDSLKTFEAPEVFEASEVTKTKVTKTESEESEPGKNKSGSKENSAQFSNEKGERRVT